MSSRPLLSIRRAAMRPSDHGLDMSDLDDLRGCYKKVEKNVDIQNEDGHKLYSLLKFGPKTSPSKSLEPTKEGISDDENFEDKPVESFCENGTPIEGLDEESLANRLESDNLCEDSSSSDDMTLSAQKKMLMKKGKVKVKTKKKPPAKKSIEVTRTVLRTVQIQTGWDDEESMKVVDTREAETSGAEKKKTKSRKTQTPKEQRSSKKRFRIRPAIPSHCTLCDKVYKNGEILRQHMKSHHVTGTIECPSCKLTFTSLRSLKYHKQRKHSDLEPVPCTFCGKKFLDKKYLRIHENIHSQANHFVCQFCGRKFIMKTNLTVHISRHHSKKSNDFICQICGKAFPFKLYLKKHFKTHTDYKPYQCTYCEAKFRENTLLRKHVNSIHLKLRPYLCQYCHKTFTRSPYLREHVESQHLGIQKNVDCSRCGETFQNRNRLRQHECLGEMDIGRTE